MVCQEIHKSLNYGHKVYNCCDPSNRDSLLDQLHSVTTGDDLVTIAVDSDTVVGALKVAQYPGFLRSTNLESKLIDFFVLLKF